MKSLPRTVINHHGTLSKRLTLHEDIEIPAGTPMNSIVNLADDVYILKGEYINMYKSGYIAVSCLGHLSPVMHYQFSQNIWKIALKALHTMETDLDRKMISSSENTDDKVDADK